MREIEHNPTGCQLTLIELPKREPLRREEWRELAAVGLERRHQRHSRSSRAEMRAFYRQVFTDEHEHPPIA